MFADRLKGLRKKAMLTQREFAQAVNVAVGTVGMWEIGKREPDFNTTVQIADFFNVSVDYLIGRKEQPDQQEKLTPENGDGLSEEMKEIVRLYDQASPQMQAAALAVLRAAEADRKAQGDGEKGQ